MADDLLAFLRARLDDTARRATAAGGDRWVRQAHESDTVAIYDSKGEPVVYDEGWPSPDQVEHILCHDPAHVLAEADAKRRIIDECAEVTARDDWEYTDAPELAELTLLMLALPYREHPDYRPGWALEA